MRNEYGDLIFPIRGSRPARRKTGTYTLKAQRVCAYKGCPNWLLRAGQRVSTDGDRVVGKHAHPES